MSLFNFDKLKDTIIGLVESKIELKKIEFKEKAEVALSEIVVEILHKAILLLIVVFASILVAIGLNHLLESSFLGFLIVLICFIIFYFIFITQKNNLKEKVGDLLSDKIDQKLKKKA